MALIDWWNEANVLINTIVAAVIVLLIGFIIGKVLGRLTQRGLNELEINRLMKKAGLSFGLEEFLGHAVEYVIYFAAIIMALDQLGVTTIVLYFIIGAIIIVLAITFLLSIKDFIPNFIAGVRLNRKKVFKVGDTITVGSVSGRVKSFGLLETILVSKKKDIIHLPNASFFRQHVKISKR